LANNLSVRREYRNNDRYASTDEIPSLTPQSVIPYHARMAADRRAAKPSNTQGHVSDEPWSLIAEWVIFQRRKQVTAADWQNVKRAGGISRLGDG
jgi:hypothetical protein